MPWLCQPARILLGSVLISMNTGAISFSRDLPDDSSGHYPVGHSREGLPESEKPIPTYASDPNHWLNELHSLLFVQSHIPDEIGGVLPEERARLNLSDEEFFNKNWQFNKRPGDQSDLKPFGGDVKISAVITVDELRRQKLLSLLSNLETREKVNQVPELTSPMSRLMLQWDILSVWWRFEGSKKWKLEQTPENIVLLESMAKAIESLAQPKETLASLPDGKRELLKQFPTQESRGTSEPYLPASLFERGESSGWVEVDRKSSKLFIGRESLRASPTFINAGSKEASVKLVQEAAAMTNDSPMLDVPVGTEVALVLTLVGIDETLSPVAAPVLDEVRIRRISGPFDLSAGNATSSKDGVEHWIYYRSRPGTMLKKDQPFRFIADTSQGLFLEYGSAKHTTFAGQCALCHRTNLNFSTHPKGISMLRPHGNPRVVDDPMTRYRLVEDEMSVVSETLKARLSKRSSSVSMKD